MPKFTNDQCPQSVSVKLTLYSVSKHQFQGYKEIIDEINPYYRVYETTLYLKNNNARFEKEMFGYIRHLTNECLYYWNIEIIARDQYGVTAKGYYGGYRYCIR